MDLGGCEMTDEELVEMVKKSGWSGIYTEWAEPTGEADWSPFKVSITVPVTMDQIRAFAKLVEKKVREECVKICDERVTAYQYSTDPWAQEHIKEAKHLAKAIKSRGQE